MSATAPDATLPQLEARLAHPGLVWTARVGGVVEGFDGYADGQGRCNGRSWA